MQQLGNILVKHFGTEKINVMHGDKGLKKLPRILSEKGVYTATPIQINVGKRKRYGGIVAISVKEVPMPRLSKGPNCLPSIKVLSEAAARGAACRISCLSEFDRIEDISFPF
ncbi:hypothetical protein [Pseudomonas aeruginosa]|uniref:hypothetical protein n=1 Tax=Pseudomonas aeruginosa TaxID=287 RepID=UPI0030F254A5